MLAAVLYYFIFYTSKGFKLRAVGMNATAAFFNGFPVNKYILFSFITSGAIAGLGGSIELHGKQFRLMSGFGSGFGFDGVAIALIAQLNPLGTAIVAAFSQCCERAQVPCRQPRRYQALWWISFRLWSLSLQ